MTTYGGTGTGRRAIGFFVLSFGLNLGAALIGSLFDIQSETVAGQIAFLFLSGSAGIAALGCVILFEPGRKLAALGFGFKPNWWWLFALVFGCAFSAIALSATVLIGDQDFVPKPNMPQFLFLMTLVNTPIQIIMATAMEEIGWRGYLYTLWRKMGFWRYSLATGVIWGLWHAPGIIVYGANYPDHPWLGACAFIVYCVLLAPVMTLIRDRGASVLASGILHGAINASDLTATNLVKVTSPFWAVDAGFGGLIALLIFLGLVMLLRRRDGPGKALGRS